MVEQRGPLWLDAQTGRRTKVRDEGTPAEAPRPPETLDAPELHNWDLTAPESWQGAVVFGAEGGRTRHLVEDAHGVAMLETDAEVLRDWPRGEGIDPTSSEEPPPGPEPAQRRPTGPLTAARLDDAFGERHMVRIPEGALPEGLEHRDSRRHLRDLGLPAWWSCNGAEYQTHSADAMRPPDDGALCPDSLPSGVSATDLIAFGTCDYGELYLHRQDGSVYIRSRLDGPKNRVLVPLAPDLDVFTRILEAVHRYSNACWHPYPVEEDQEAVAQVFLGEIDELAPGLLDRTTPSGTVWSWLHAGITELGVDGF
ncbi:SUKH-4 family immunity protein [Streptomyces sp. NPDC001796]|uniref:SUKH-4 family immunity protein n=1 Tax=Streptomyces sp. NPDC001796 TaxID=3364609 RepID=UPI0036D0CD99